MAITATDNKKLNVRFEKIILIMEYLTVFLHKTEFQSVILVKVKLKIFCY